MKRSSFTDEQIAYGLRQVEGGTAVVLEVAQSMSATQWTRHSIGPIALYGEPRSITVDHGTKFGPRGFDEWAHRRGVLPDFIRPGKPMETGYIESFNGKLRDEYLKANQFLSIDDARSKIEP